MPHFRSAAAAAVVVAAAAAAAHVVLRPPPPVASSPSPRAEARQPSSSPLSDYVDPRMAVERIQAVDRCHYRHRLAVVPSLGSQAAET